MKKIVYVLTAFALAFLIVTFEGLCVLASESACISIGTVSGSTGDTVDVTINLSDNPGLVALRFSIEYDASSLQLLSATDEGLLGSETAFFGNDISANPYVLMWEDSFSSSNYTDNGTLVTLSFKILENAKDGNTEITIVLDSGSTFNSALNSVALETENGSVIVENGAADKPSISLGSATAHPNDTIYLPVTIEQNPGIVALRLAVSYDTSKLTLIQVTDGSLLGTDTSTFGNDLTASPYNLMWEDSLSSINYVSDGVIATLKFTVKNTAQGGITPVTIAVDEGSTFNSDLDNVAFEASNGTVAIDRLNITSSVTSITVGTNLQLNVGYSLSTATPEIVSWTSSNDRIATVSSDGTVTAKRHGNVKITAADTSGNTAEYCIQVLPTTATVSIFNYSGSFTQKLNWWKSYSTAKMSLGYQTYNCSEAVRYVWSSSSSRVKIDQQGNITNTGAFSRSATITLTSYNADGNVLAKDSVKVSFYKFNWQRNRLQSQSIVSDNVFGQNATESALEKADKDTVNTALEFIMSFVGYIFDVFKVVIFAQ